MLDIKFIRSNADLVKENCKIRKINVDVDALLKLDDEKKLRLQGIEKLKAERRKNSKSKPKESDFDKLREMGEIIKTLESELAQLNIEYNSLLLKIPNLTHPETPIGGEEDYKILYKNREPKMFSFKPLNHEELLLNNDLVDFERGAKVAASKFYFFKNNIVKLNLALINYALDIAMKNGYTPMETPDIAKDEILMGIGFNPRGPETQVYSIEGDSLSLVGTAEITVGGYHFNEILDLEKGPKKYIALSHCFRTEAGSYGRTSKGLYRVHQFTKLEMFVFCKPNDSEKYHQEILDIEKKIVDGLDLPYRVIDIASGDLGGPAYRKYDIEAWMTMKGDEKHQGGYGEITSCSNCTDYQARRLNIKYKKDDGSLDYVHTLNGTAVVLSRFPLAIVENHQQSDGTIKVPKVIKKYCGLKRL